MRTRDFSRRLTPTDAIRRLGNGDDRSSGVGRRSSAIQSEAEATRAMSEHGAVFLHRTSSSMAEATGPVLVVDDDEDCRAFVTVILEMSGFSVIAASDGEEALGLPREQHPCLILLDLMMPGMDGFTFRDIQQRTPELAQIPVILISALHNESQVQRRFGPVAAVPKPIDVDALLAEVVRQCEVRGDID